MKKKNCVRANMIQYLYNKNEFVLKGRSYFSPVLLNKSISSIVMQNGESQNGGNKKLDTPNFLYLWISGGKKCSFGKFSMFYFLATSVLKFTVLPYFRVYVMPDIT